MTILSDQLGLAIRLARAGEREQARRVFEQIVEHSPAEAEAWLWLSELSDHLDDQVAALDKAVLCIEAVNESQNNLQGRLDAIRGVSPLPAPSTREPVESPLLPVAPPQVVTLPQDISGRENARHEKVEQITALQWVERLIVLDEKQEAVHLLEGLLSEDPACEDALLMLCELTPRSEEKKRLLERVLVLNPGNLEAAWQIKQISVQAPESPVRRSFLERISDETARVFKRRLFSR